jgi:hypothetical protein
MGIDEGVHHGEAEDTGRKRRLRMEDRKDP